MAWSEAIAGVARAFNEVWSWATGGRSKDENALRDEVQRLERKSYVIQQQAAIGLASQADAERVRDELNAVHASLKRLQERSAARRSKSVRP